MIARLPIKSMIATDVLFVLEHAAEKTGVRLNDVKLIGNRVRFTLRPIRGQKNRYQRVSTSPFHRGRRVSAICGHGHRDFMRSVYDRYPEMIFQSAMATYRNRTDFEQWYQDVLDRQRGEHLYSIAYGDACTCAEEG